MVSLQKNARAHSFRGKCPVWTVDRRKNRQKGVETEKRWIVNREKTDNSSAKNEQLLGPYQNNFNVHYTQSHDQRG